MNRLEYVIANRNRGKVSEMKSGNEIRNGKERFTNTNNKRSNHETGSIA